MNTTRDRTALTLIESQTQIYTESSTARVAL